VKIVKLIVSLAAGLFLAFALIGFFVPEVEFNSTIDIAAPVDEVYAIYTDEALMGQWIQGFVSIENISGVPLEVGSRWRLVFDDERGGLVEMIEEITIVEPMQRFAFVSESDDVFVEADTRFFSDGAGGTRIEGTNILRGRSWFMRSLLPLFKGSMQQRLDEDLGRLREVIENIP